MFGNGYENCPEFDGRHAPPLSHIILIPNQPVFIPQAYRKSSKEQYYRLKVETDTSHMTFKNID